MAQVEWHVISIFISCTIFFILNVPAKAKTSLLSKQCSEGLNTPGYTEPHGDILIEYGNPLEITCILNDEYLKEYGANASKNLYFDDGKKVIPNEMIEELNPSSIRLYIKNPPKSQSVYTCKLKTDSSKAVCLNQVVVGTKPLPVEDFSCIGYNYENLTCTWTAPENYAVTNYSLNYFFPGRASRYLRNTCPNITKLGNNKMSCLWTVTSDPQYRQAQRTYYFELNSANALGTNQLNITFSHFQHVLSGPPENLTYINTTSDTILLRWSVPYAMQAFPPGLQHRVLYQSEYGGKEWKFGGLIQTTTPAEMRYVHFNLTDLKFAHAIYDIRVSMRSYAAEPDDEFMWSKNSSITARTRSTVPGTPPVTNIGSFEIVTSGESLSIREVYVYWQQIAEEIKNGENFMYDIELETANGLYSLIQPVEITNAYAKFKNLSVGESYIFHVWSKNSVGRSIHKSRIVVPKQAERVVEPLLFTKIAYGEGKYELSWEPPKHYSVKNYTIFWCSHDRDRPYQCTGYLSWIEIPPYKRVHNITVSEDKIHQFAISANTESSSSGMVWAACTVIHNQAVGKMRSVWVNRVGSTYIEVSWKLDCSDRIGSVEGFVIYYCNIVGPSDTSCKGPEKNLTIFGSHGASSIELANITGLEPYKTYMLAAAVITKHSSVSQKSDPLLGTTLEGAPSSPTNLEVIGVTNSTITISWLKPNSTNGKLKYYMIYYNTYSDRVDSDVNKFTINNLVSYAIYNLSIIACTVECSKPSIVQRVQTKGGYPGKISQPSVSFQNDSYIVIEWDRPLQPRGNNDVYEVNFKEKLQYENKTNAIVNVTDTRYMIKECGGDGKYNSFYISVRAVNVFNGTRYEGPWSDELESYCRTSPNFFIWILIPACVILGLILFCLAKKMYYHCQQMQDVEVKLPPGLVPAVITDKGLSHWSTPKLQDEPLHHLADEELLLIKMTDGRNTNGDSSGCSSAHESVISSSESNTQSIGTVDSGTEQPRSPNEDIQTNSLRQRNVSTRPVANKGYVTMPTENINGALWNPKGSNLPTGYCVLGVDPTPIISVNPHYALSPPSPPDCVKLPELATPYVVIGDSNNPSKCNYVPLETPEVNEMKPYVLTGHKGSIPDLMRLDSVKSNEINDAAVPYVQIADPSGIIGKPSSNSFMWQHPASSISGYVTVGDSTPRVSDPNKGYVPHRHFESKALKED